MNSLLASSLRALPQTSPTSKYFNHILKSTQPHHFLFISSKFKTPNFIPSCSSSSNGSIISPSEEAFPQNGNIHTEVSSPQVGYVNFHVPKFSFSDQAFFLLAFIACTVSSIFFLFRNIVVTNWLLQSLVLFKLVHWNY